MANIGRKLLEKILAATEASQWPERNIMVPKTQNMHLIISEIDNLTSSPR